MQFLNILFAIYVKKVKCLPFTDFEIPIINESFELITHNQDDHVSRKMHKITVWEPTETRCVIEILSPNDFVIDVGANIGYYTVLFSKLIGSQGEIIALEPDKKNFSILSLNVKLNQIKNVKLLCAAASDFQGDGMLYSSNWNFGDHRIYPSQDQSSGNNIKLITLDDLIKQRGKAPKLLKIDCQGAEIMILKGLKESLNSVMRPKSIIVEFWPYGITQSGGEVKELLDLLPSSEYVLWDISRWHDSPKRTSIANLEALSNNEIAPETQMFTNILMVLSQEVELIKRIDSLCE
ncbi:FkbM family methyltransferase [Methylophaga sp.]|uniref:FkbM family methyltransferase n=1 Tax=Methylophaga sp. TaxID=2024840 RepID=UPI00272C7836|nr:FkbM family methyltransferase [Methylophaga sp.]